MLEIHDLSVTLGRRKVLHDLSLNVAGGELLAVCGPNGAGKSTLLRAALAEVEARGTIRLNGHNPRRTRPEVLARLRAVLPQDNHVAFAFTVAEIVAMGLAAGDFPDRADWADLARQALAAVGLAGYGPRDIRNLSGGERQRVHLARALAQVWEPRAADGPRWLFLDEPVASLDLGHQLTAMQLARDFADRGGAVVVVIHDLNLAAMFADRMAFLIDGRLVAEGPPPLVLNAALLRRAYGCRVALNTAPTTGPWFVPQCCEGLGSNGMADAP